jgi:hypothetical protein
VLRLLGVAQLESTLANVLTVMPTLSCQLVLPSQDSYTIMRNLLQLQSRVKLEQFTFTVSSFRYSILARERKH